MPDETPHLRLPYMLAGQAQKHVTHNEALRLLDALVQMSVLDRNLTAPPGSPADGARYIVASGGSGAWDDWDLNVAYWVDGAWMKLVPQEGWLVWVADEDMLLVWSGAAWAEVSAGGGGDGAFDTLSIGGATADATNRLAVAAVASLFTHGGSDHRIVVNKNAAGDTASVLFQTGWSGRAEFGTLGTDTFALKVSSDGSSWVNAIDFTTTRVNASLPVSTLIGGFRSTLSSGATEPTEGGYLHTISATQTKFGHKTSGGGVALIDINPQPSHGSSPANFRFFRETNTTGAAQFSIHSGDGTAGTNARLSGKGSDSFVCALTGNFGVGTSSPTAKCHVNGSLSKTSGSFDIKHPDPAMHETHRLRHCFVESPTAGDNLYRYRVAPTEAGETLTLALPGYWRHLNENPQVWISAEGHFGRAYGRVDGELATLSVTCETPGVYNVLLIGTRKDADAVNYFGATGVEYEAPPPSVDMTDDDMGGAE